MWQSLQAFTQSQDTREFRDEILLTITRGSSLLLTGVFLLWAYLLGACQPGKYLTAVMLIAAPVLLTAVVTWYLSKSHLRLAQMTAMVGLLISSVLILYLMRQPTAAFLLALLPLLAAIMMGWPAALITDILLIGVVVILGNLPNLFPLKAIDQQAIILGGTLTGTLSSLGVWTMYSMAKNAYIESQLARRQMEDSLKQRMELLQTEEDLLQANGELARLSDRLKTMTQVAEDARRVKEEFVANVSHELRTPLNMIIGFSELIAKAPHVYGALPPALLADITAIQRNSQHLSDLVNDVLDLS
jgi:signal transduction histidine kinase